MLPIVGHGTADKQLKEHIIDIYIKNSDASIDVKVYFWCDTNRAVQPQKMASGLKSKIKEERRI